MAGNGQKTGANPIDQKPRNPFGGINKGASDYQRGSLPPPIKMPEINQEGAPSLQPRRKFEDMFGKKRILF